MFKILKKWTKMDIKLKKNYEVVRGARHRNKYVLNFFVQNEKKCTQNLKKQKQYEVVIGARQNIFNNF